MKVLFDTNVLLDALLARESFVEDAAYLFEAVELGQIAGFISATTVTDIYYLAERHTKSVEVAVTAVVQLLALMSICAVDRTLLERAVSLGFSDFEDAVQVASAIASAVDVIVTRDVGGFATSPVQVLSPDALKRQLV